MLLSFQLVTRVLPYHQKASDISLEIAQTPRRPLKDTPHNFTSFQNIFMKELEGIRGFSRSVEKKFEELENAIIGLSEPRISNWSESSSLKVELLKKQISTHEKVLIE